jgi:dipeptidyl aminopeptidase/acylaminoacyl peptidase
VKSRLFCVGLAVAALLQVGTARAAPEPGSILAFASYRSNDSGIYTINTDGTGLQRLTGAPDPAFEGEPTYSPSGARIAYVCGNFELCVMNADGSGEGRVTTNRWPEHWDYVSHPTWSPDGTKIAFATSGEGRSRIDVINADGSGLTELMGTTGNDEDPAWSPNGATIAFDSYRGDRNASIYVMNTDGTHPLRLTNGANDESTPAWSPDGSRIVYDEYDGNETHLAIMNASGGQKDLLTSGTCDEYDPAWSPFGATLAFDENCEGMLGIDVGDFSRVVRVTAPKEGFDAYPAWRPITNAASPAAPPRSQPVSMPTDETRLVSAYTTWSTRVEVIDYSLDLSPKGERATIADDLQAVADLSAVRPQTARGSALKRNALLAFRYDIASSNRYILSLGANARGRHRAARRYERTADALAKKAQHKFDVADGIANTPY